MRSGGAIGRGQRRGPSWFVSAWFARGAAVLVLLIAACTPLYSDHGYVPTDDELALVRVGIDTRDSVGATIGRPSASGVLNDQGWYYVQSRYKTSGAQEPVEIDRQVVAISFTPAGIVENVERFGLDKGRIVPLSRRITTTNIKGKSALAQIFGNIGRLDASNLFK